MAPWQMHTLQLYQYVAHCCTVHFSVSKRKENIWLFHSLEADAFSAECLWMLVKRINVTTSLWGQGSYEELIFTISAVNQ